MLVKSLLLLFLFCSVSPFAHGASSVLLAFEGQYGAKGSLQVQLRANGDVVLVKGQSARLEESLLATLDAGLVKRFEDAIAGIDPKVELPSVKTKECRGEIREVAVYGSQFAAGRKVISQSVGCTGESVTFEDQSEAGRQARWRSQAIVAFLEGFQRALVLW